MCLLGSSGSRCHIGVSEQERSWGDHGGGNRRRYGEPSDPVAGLAPGKREREEEL